MNTLCKANFAWKMHFIQKFRLRRIRSHLSGLNKQWQGSVSWIQMCLNNRSRLSERTINYYENKDENNNFSQTASIPVNDSTDSRHSEERDSTDRSGADLRVHHNVYAQDFLANHDVCFGNVMISELLVRFD